MTQSYLVEGNAIVNPVNLCQLGVVAGGIELPCSADGDVSNDLPASQNSPRAFILQVFLRRVPGSEAYCSISNSLGHDQGPWGKLIPCAAPLKVIIQDFWVKSHLTQ